MLLAPKEIILKDGSKAILKTPEVADAEQLLQCIKSTCGETEFLLRYPEEWDATTAAQEAAWVWRKQSSPDDLVIACYAADEIAGICELNFGNKLKTAHRGTVSISILKAYWDLGIGSAMFREMIAAAKARGTEFLQLEFVEGNDRARHLYEKFGFVVCSERPRVLKLKDGTYRSEFYMQRSLLD